MIFRQLYDIPSGTYTYLLAAQDNAKGIIIDPVFGQADCYLKLCQELSITLAMSIDTHVDADHITASGILRARCGCEILMGEHSLAEGVTKHVSHNELIDLDGLQLKALHTPGHTDDSYCFLCDDHLFTGDTLLIRKTGRTDFQNGDAGQQYDSIFNRLLKLPDHTFIYPGHDYNGMSISTIFEERHFNPRLQIPTREAYITLMENLNLPKPKHMDVAVPANLRCGVGS